MFVLSLEKIDMKTRLLHLQTAIFNVFSFKQDALLCTLFLRTYL